MKQPKAKSELFSNLLTHLLMGACLGLLCATVVLFTDLMHLRDFFANKPDPDVAELRFALNMTLAFALSAALTGFIFMQVDKR
jgi:hypothetical protein